MAAFSSELLAAIRERRAGVRTLVEMQFASGTKRVQLGFGSFVAGGFTWSGVGEGVSVSSLDQTTQGEAGQATFTLSGTSAEILATAKTENGSEYRQRPVTVYLQFFDTLTNDAIETPRAVWTGLMDNMRISRSTNMRVSGSDGDDGAVRSVTLTAESIFQDRARPPYGSYTDADQKSRYAGDRGCERVTGLVDTVVAWPVN
jgi:hypothetical protein